MINIFIFITSFLVTNLYSLSYNSSEGVSKPMSAYAGKKILIVSIATGSVRAPQIGQLQLLRQQFGDSLVIIAFPSNSFGNETHTNAEIKSICQNQYNATFQIAEKCALTGSQINPIFNWLTHSTENGAFNEQIEADFTKFLIDKEGNLIGIYAASVLPMDAKIINAINEN